MAHKNYCLAYREAWTHPAFNDLREAAIWNFLYQNAFWEDGERNFNGYTFKLKRGEIVVSTSFLAKGFGMTEKGVRVVIQKLERLGMVGKRGASHGTIVTICNYDKYQLSRRAKGEPKGEPRASQGRAKGDNKNKVIKERTNEQINKNNDNNLSDFENFWNAYGKIGNKQQALKSWKKLKGVTYEEIIRGLRKYQEWARANTWYNPKHASTWLNNQGWEDEYTIKEQSGGKQNEKDYKTREAIFEGLLSCN